ncbi:hypothetical protein MUGA111182_09200 [Mucilaginibacter galii]|uniref:Uncharacterized protein n=1 Tax=Mucilaginibacter galii TaxID=2005073 RepID=A0A917J7I7_9SPHI|nr:hypothetical protein [Mucilaginibacter galii]GGI49397.1 hypothetical protein GCM10011425_06090 [Mucilaginibacter galii]
MQRNIVINRKISPCNRIYGLIALVLLVTFIGRVSLNCVNGGGSVKTQQLLAEDNQDQSDKQQDSKTEGQKFTEFIWPGVFEMPGLTVHAHVVAYPVPLFLSVKVPLITVLTPPPDRISA